MKGGLGKAALATPEVAFADQQALAEQRPDDEFRQGAFVQLGVIEDKQLLNVLGAIEKDAARAHHGHVDNVAVLASETLQSAEGIVADIERETKNGQPFRARRRVVSAGGHEWRPGIISSTRSR
jgi:hypothetical protein